MPGTLPPGKVLVIPLTRSAAPTADEETVAASSPIASGAPAAPAPQELGSQTADEWPEEDEPAGRSGSGLMIVVIAAILVALVGVGVLVFMLLTGGGPRFQHQVFRAQDGKHVTVALTFNDCGNFRAINPYCKKWSDGYWSSDYSRSGWCPGDIVAPLELDLTDHLTPGTHTVRFMIENVRPEDENGHFGYWRISGRLLGWK